MTKSTPQTLPVQDSFANLAAQMARNPETLHAFNDLMADAKRKMEIGLRISEARKRRGLAQAQVVERAGLGQGAVRKYQYWEAGKHLPSVEVLEDIAEIVGVSFDYLMNGGELAPPAKDVLGRLDSLEVRLAALETKLLSELAKAQIVLAEMQRFQEQWRQFEEAPGR